MQLRNPIARISRSFSSAQVGVSYSAEHEGLATLTMNRPEARNAMGSTMMQQVHEYTFCMGHAFDVV